MIRWCRRVAPIALSVVTLVITMGGQSTESADDVHGGTDVAPPYDLFIYVGEIPIWSADEIRYTVTQTTPVEARFMTPTGEIIVLLKLGVQTPGQYTLPWHGTAMGAPMVGSYNFELYFGDEYAAQLQVIVAPHSAMGM